MELEAHDGVIGPYHADARCADDVPDPNCRNQKGSEAGSVVALSSRDLQQERTLMPLPSAE